MEACAFAHRNKDDKAKLVSKLLVDSDKRFRFNFILGNWTQNAEAAVGDNSEFEKDDEEVEKAGFRSGGGGRRPRWTFVAEAGFLRRASLIDSGTSAFETARRELQPTDEQDEPVVKEYWLG